MRALLAIALVSTAFANTKTFAAPFAAADQNPLLAGYLLASTATARLPARDTTQLTGTLNWSSTAAIQRDDDETLIADVESRDWRLAITHALTDKFALSIQLPYRTASGGKLDRVVDNWHSLLGLPNADRPALPQDNLLLSYRRNELPINISERGNGGGDIAIAIGYQLAATPKHATSVWVHLKAPTGASDELTGSGSTDALVNLAHEQQLSARWSTFATMATAYLGAGNLLPQQQRRWIVSGAVGLDFRYSRSLTFTAQLDGHTAVYRNSGLDLLGNAWILTVGGEYRWQRWRAQFGVGEDVKVEASPDVNFVFSVATEIK